MSVEDYSRIIRIGLDTGSVKVRKANTTILIWRNQEHFDEWVKLADFSMDVRVAQLRTELLPITLPDTVDTKQVSVVGIAFGEAVNYSDTVLKFHLVLTHL
jgi:hypothetical protein